MKLKDVGKNGWPCSVCRLHSTTKCGLSQALGFQWAIFRTKIKDGKVTCQWCGKSSKLTECHYNEGDRSGVHIVDRELCFEGDCYQKCKKRLRRQEKYLVTQTRAKVGTPVLRNGLRRQEKYFREHRIFFPEQSPINSPEVELNYRTSSY